LSHELQWNGFLREGRGVSDTEEKKPEVKILKRLLPLNVNKYIACDALLVIYRIFG